MLQTGEQIQRRKPKVPMLRSVSFEFASSPTAEIQEDYLASLRMDRYCKKFQAGDEPLPAPTRFRFSKGSTCSTFHGTESGQNSSLKLKQLMKRSLSEPNIQALTTKNVSDTNSVHQVNEVITRQSPNFLHSATNLTMQLTDGTSRLMSTRK